MKETIPVVSKAGAPTLQFVFDGDTVRCEFEGTTLYAEARAEGAGAGMRIVDETGFVLLDVEVNERDGRTITENVMDVGAAFIWSHWRFLQADRSAISNDAELIRSCGDSGERWAYEFCRHAGYADPDVARGWFANAIEHACDVRRWARDKADAERIRRILVDRRDRDGKLALHDGELDALIDMMIGKTPTE